LTEEQINQRIQQLTTAIQQMSAQATQMQVNALRLQGELDAWTKIKRQINDNDVGNDT